MKEIKNAYDYERSKTQKFEGLYTAREIKLNQELYKECTKDTLDFAAIECLLKQGADPNGPCDGSGWDVLDHLYGELICFSQDNISIYLPEITELFLKYGMDLDHPRIPYDGENSLNPMWNLAFITNENTIIALKMLLDYGISAESFGQFWGHAMTDFVHIECGDPENDEFWNYQCTWTLKMLMLGASYDHILNNDEDIKEFICCDLNDYDIHSFRDWNRFEYRYDTSHCQYYPELYGSVIRIYEKDSGKEVWKLGIGVAGRKALEEMDKTGA